MLIYVVSRSKHFKVRCLVQVLQVCLALMGGYDVEKMLELIFFYTHQLYMIINAVFETLCIRDLNFLAADSQLLVDLVILLSCMVIEFCVLQCTINVLQWQPFCVVHQAHMIPMID